MEKSIIEVDVCALEREKFCRYELFLGCQSKKTDCFKGQRKLG